MASPAYSGPWKQVRLAVLERDSYRCQIRLPGCTFKATQVDHILPVKDHGPTFDPALLRAACQSCNLARHSKQTPSPSRRW